MCFQIVWSFQRCPSPHGHGHEYHIPYRCGCNANTYTADPFYATVAGKCPQCTSVPSINRMCQALTEQQQLEDGNYFSGAGMGFEGLQLVVLRQIEELRGAVRC